MPYCGNCGKELPETARFCPECGTRAPERVAAGQCIVIKGDTTGQVYVYDPKPLKKVKPGDLVWVKPILDGKPMKSKLTKGTWTQQEAPDTIALAYEGRQFGMVARASDIYRGLLCDGYDVVIAAQCVGWYAKGYPELQLCGYSYTEFDEWREIVRFSGLAMQPSAIDSKIRKYIDSEYYIAAKLVDGEPFWCNIVYEQPAPGSKAKPKIALVRDDYSIYKCGAATKLYKQLLAHVGKTVPAIAASQTNESTLESWYRITLYVSMS